MMSDVSSPQSAFDLLALQRESCACKCCLLPLEIQGEVCKRIPLYVFHALRRVSHCWNLRFRAFGPGIGVLQSTLYGKMAIFCRSVPSSKLVLAPGSIQALCPRLMACGQKHFLALTANGDMYAWGDNTHGQLGDGTNDPCGAPKLVPLQEHVIEVACGEFASYALTRQGEVFQWGNHSGRSPRRVEGLSHVTVTQISAMTEHALALTAQGEVYVWGTDEDVYGDFHGPYGGGIDVVRVGGALDGQRVVQVSAGLAHSYALTEAGKLYGWGWNKKGQCGVPPDDSEVVGMPVELPLPHRWTFVQAGRTHTHAINDQGTLFHWGTCSPMYEPLAFHALEEKRIVRSAVNRYGHFVALTDQGELWEWGFIERGREMWPDAQRIEAERMPLGARLLVTGDYGLDGVTMVYVP